MESQQWIKWWLYDAIRPNLELTAHDFFTKDYLKISCSEMTEWWEWNWNLLDSPVKTKANAFQIQLACKHLISFELKLIPLAFLVKFFCCYNWKTFMNHFFKIWIQNWVISLDKCSVRIPIVLLSQTLFKVQKCGCVKKGHHDVSWIRYTGRLRFSEWFIHCSISWEHRNRESSDKIALVKIFYALIKRGMIKKRAIESS